MVLITPLLARLASAILLLPLDVIEQELPMLAPLPGWAEFQHRQLVDRLLRKCWNEEDGFEIHDDEWSIDGMNPTSKDSFRPSTYGEITLRGARQLFHYMELTNKQTSDVVFMDWGSGTGKLVAQACLEMDQVERAVGIELSKFRHQAAVRSIERLIQELPVQDQTKINQRLHVQQSDLCEYDSSDATHVYISSLCFPTEMMHQLEVKLTKHSQLRCVASLRKFPTLSIIPQVHYVEMSWSRPKGVPVYFYFVGET